MATPFSDPSFYLEFRPIDSSNWDLALKAMQYKQNKFDTNKLRLQQATEQLGNLNIAQDAVRGKFERDMLNIATQIDRMGKLVMDDDTTYKLDAMIKSALTPSVLSAVSAGNEYAKQMQDIAAVQSKHADLVTQGNIQYMLMNKVNGQSWNDYLASDDPNVMWQGKLEYTPYTDYNKNVSEGLLKLLKSVDPYTTLEPSAFGPQIYQKLKQQGLSSEEIMVYLNGALGTQELKQMEIDAFLKYNGYEDERGKALVIDDFNAYYDRAKANINGSIAAVELQMKNLSEDSDAYKIKQSALTAYQNNLTNLETSKGVIDSPDLSTNTLRQVGTNLFIDGWMMDKAGQFSLLRNSSFEGIMNDPNIALEKELLELEEIKSKINKNNAEALKAQNANNPPAGQDWIMAAPAPTPTEDVLYLEKNIRESQRGLLQTATENGIAVLQSAYTSAESTNPEEASEAKSLITMYATQLFQKALAAGETPTVDFRNVESMKTMIDALQPKYDQSFVGLAGQFDDFTPEYVGYNPKLGRSFVNLRNSLTSYKRVDDELNTLKKNAINSTSSELNEKALTEFGKNPNYLYISPRDNKPYSIRRDLVDQGLLDADGNPTLNAKISDSRRFISIDLTRKAQRALSAMEDVTPVMWARYHSITRKDIAIYPKGHEYLKEVADYFGDNIESITLRKGYTVDGPDNVYVIDPNTKTGAYLKAVKESNGKGLRFTTFADITTDYHTNKEYMEGIIDLYGKVKTNVEYSVYKEDPNYKQIFQLAKLGYSPDGTSRAFSDDGGPFVISKLPDGNYKIFQETKDTSAAGKTISATTVVSQELFNMNRANFPNLFNRINFDTDSEGITYNNSGKSYRMSKPITYKKGGIKNSTHDYAMEAAGIAKGRLYEEPTLVGIRTQNAPVISIIQQFDPQVQQKLENAVKSSSDYRISAEVADNGLGSPSVIFKLYNKNNLNKIIYTSDPQPLGGDVSISMVREVLDFSPQLFYTDILENILRTTAGELGISGTYPEYYKQIFK